MPFTQLDWCSGNVYICICQVLGLNLGQVTGNPEVRRGISPTLQTNSGIATRFLHYRFLPNPLQFTVQ
jgi:hypothetical protein